MKRIGAYLFHLRLSAEDRNMLKILDMLEEDKKAKQKGIETIRADMNFNLPFADKFKVESLIGIGLYPFPPLFSRFLEILDPIHANFITIKVRKADNP